MRVGGWGHLQQNKMATIYIESFRGGGLCGEECKLVSKELASRSPPWTVVGVPREEGRLPAALSREGSVVVGSPEFVRRALTQLQLPIPAPPDYPACLSQHLHRTVARSTLGEVKKQFQANPSLRLFVKPAQDAKAFNGELLGGAEEADMWLGVWIGEHGASYPVQTSTALEMLAEYRVYVLSGVVKGVARYGRSPPEGCPPLDLALVQAAAQTLHQSSEALAGCAMDFAVCRAADGSHFCALVEVNDGVFTGFYPGVPVADFTDMVIARWRQLVDPGAVPGEQAKGEEAQVAGGGGSSTRGV